MNKILLTAVLVLFICTQVLFGNLYKDYVESPVVSVVQLNENGNITKTYTKPTDDYRYVVARYIPVETEPILYLKGPNAYTCDLYNGFAYITTLITNGYNLTSTVESSDYSEYLLTDEATSVRVLLTRDGIMRVYAVNADGKGIDEPYIHE